MFYLVFDFFSCLRANFEEKTQSRELDSTFNSIFLKKPVTACQCYLLTFVKKICIKKHFLKVNSKLNYL